MSPVSPTFFPDVSSLIRSSSPSNFPIGIDSDGVTVLSTTNSCVIVPSLATVNVTGPAEGVPEGVTDHWFRLTVTSFVGALDEGGVDDAPLALEHAVPIRRHPTSNPVHRSCPLIVLLLPPRDISEPWRSPDAGPRAERPGIGGPSGRATRQRLDLRGARPFAPASDRRERDVSVAVATSLGHRELEQHVSTLGFIACRSRDASSCLRIVHRHTAARDPELTAGPIAVGDAVVHREPAAFAEIAALRRCGLHEHVCIALGEDRRHRVDAWHAVLAHGGDVRRSRPKPLLAEAGQLRFPVDEP